jgi:hypothetical protein
VGAGAAGWLAVELGAGAGAGALEVDVLAALGALGAWAGGASPVAAEWCEA